MEGKKELLGIWVGKNEGSKFWRASSEGWYIQWEIDPPGEESNPVARVAVWKGNQNAEAYRQAYH